MADPAAPGGERDLVDYLRGIRRGWWVILLSVGAVVAGVVAVSLRQQDVYRATGELLLQPRTNPLAETERQVSAAYVPTQIRILESPAVAEVARVELGPNSGITAEPIGNTTIVSISAESPSAQRAARIVNSYAQAYIDVVREREADAILALSEQLQTKISELDASIAALDARVANAPPEERSIVSSEVDPERARLIDQRVVYRQKLDEQSFQTVVGEGGSQIVRPAVAPSSPVRPTPVRNGLIGLGVGLILGIALALGFDHFNDAIRNREDLERALAGRLVPILGHVPASGAKSKKPPQVASLVAPNSPVAEAYRSLRTSVQFLGIEGGVGTLQVTSPAAAEGKTTTAANLAAVMARAGQKVIVLDCDLRRPRIHELFGCTNHVGFTSVLIGDVPIESALQPVESDDGLPLLLMASGPIPPNPSEMLASESAANVFRSLGAYADIVVVDSPPLLPVTDAAIVATMVDATMLVVMSGLTTRKRTQRAMERLAQVDANLVGLVLNRTTAEFEDVYGYRYYGRRQRNPDGLTRVEQIDSLPR